MNNEETLLREPRGMLCHRQDGGPSGCPKCGWRGVPIYVRGTRLNACPVCERELLDEFTGQRVVEKVGRNDPCPCGSGRKAKKCHYR